MECIHVHIVVGALQLHDDDDDDDESLCYRYMKPRYKWVYISTQKFKDFKVYYITVSQKNIPAIISRSLVK